MNFKFEIFFQLKPTFFVVRSELTLSLCEGLSERIIINDSKQITILYTNFFFLLLKSEHEAKSSFCGFWGVFWELWGTG